MSSILEGLNPQQLAAVTHGEGPLLVLAGAGSGKTRVITRRIAWLIREKQIDPEHIVAVTFTNKAAKEMRERLVKLCGSVVAKGITTRTFHAFGVRLIRRYATKLGLPKAFAVVDTADQTALLRRLLKERKAAKSVDIAEVGREISRAKSALIDVEDFVSNGAPASALAASIYGPYQRALRAMGGVDFDDLIALPVRLLENDSEARESLRSSLRWLLVDEFQDTSALQLRLIFALTGRAGNLTAVGDDDQAIYGWRGADVRNVMQFERNFSGARVLALEQNYRSTPAILDLANKVIERSPGRRPKRLRATRPAGLPVQLVRCRDEVDEAEGVAGDIDALQSSTRPWSDFAVLYRTNAQSRPIEEALRGSRIPYVVVGGTRFFDRKEVRDLLAYWKLLDNPHDEISLRRVVNWPSRGIGTTTVEQIADYARLHACSLWTALTNAASIPGLQGRAVRACGEFQGLLEPLREQALDDPYGAAQELMDRSDLLAALRAECRTSAEASKRVGHIQEMLDSLRLHLQGGSSEGEEGGEPPLRDFLARVSLDQREEVDDGSGHRVTLATLHTAKGLEFPVVFLVGVEEGLLPFRRQGYIRDEEEERRLAYVGITRAQEQLQVSWCKVRKHRGDKVRRSCSRFLLDLDDVVESVDRSQASAGVDEEQLEKERDEMFDAIFRILE